MDLINYIRDIPDFPKKGILYKDITPLLRDKKAFSFVIDNFSGRHSSKKIDKVLGIEARGFIFGASLAKELNCGFVPIRKPKKLPYKSFSQSYSLEYGTDSLEIHTDAISRNDNILIIDDVLATGGTSCAAINLLSNFNCNLIECLFLMEIKALKGGINILKKQKSFFSLLKV